MKIKPDLKQRKTTPEIFSQSLIIFIIINLSGQQSSKYKSRKNSPRINNNSEKKFTKITVKKYFLP